MKIAITGGRGFIGKLLVKRLLKQGHALRVLSRNPLEMGDFPPDVESVAGDLADPDVELAPLVDGVELLFHCAAEIRNKAAMEVVNVEGTRKLIEAASGNVRRWVQLSSVGVYGPVLEGRVNEDWPHAPQGLYEITKERADCLVDEAAQAGAFERVTLQPSNVFGPGMVNRSLFQMIHMINQGMFFFIGKPGASANYVPVEQVVDALMACGFRSKAVGRDYIISDWRTLEHFVGTICEALAHGRVRWRVPMWLARLGAFPSRYSARWPLNQSRVDNLTLRSRYDTGRIIQELAFRPTLSQEMGLYNLVDQWREEQKAQQVEVVQSADALGG
ncbi:MAG: NAD-dependent epimerase/dehydratase family protein [Magnetococcales bacterium]|nr:NAD-dependent epimerase/dehydratase family protein [Magnetococcales bacterium]